MNWIEPQLTTSAWIGGSTRKVATTKRVTYRCGCILVLCDWNDEVAPPECKTHNAPMREIITTTIFEDNR